MENRKIVTILLLSIVLIMPACGQRLEKSENQKEGETAGRGAQSIEVYYVDTDNMVIASKRTEIKSELSEGIVSALIDEGILKEGCIVNRVEVDSESKKMKIDINTVFGEHIRSMGTAGEEEIIQCTARTYLDAYKCEQILITEEGKELITGHSVVKEYLSYE